MAMSIEEGEQLRARMIGPRVDRGSEFTPRDAGRALGELAREIGAQAIDDFGRPEFRAGFGASVLTAAVLSRMRLPGLVVILTSVMLGAAVEQVYGMASDIHEKLTGNATGEVQ